MDILKKSEFLKKVALDAELSLQIIRLDDDLEIAIAPVTPEEDLVINEYIERFRVSGKYSFEELASMQELESVVWSIKMINGEEINHGELAIEEVNGEKKLMALHDIMRTAVEKWPVDVKEKILLILDVQSTILYPKLPPLMERESGVEREELLKFLEAKMRALSDAKDN